MALIPQVMALRVITITALLAILQVRLHRPLHRPLRGNGVIVHPVVVPDVASLVGAQVSGAPPRMASVMFVVVPAVENVQDVMGRADGIYNNKYIINNEKRSWIRQC